MSRILHLIFEWAFLFQGNKAFPQNYILKLESLELKMDVLSFDLLGGI